MQWKLFKLAWMVYHKLFLQLFVGNKEEMLVKYLLNVLTLILKELLLYAMRIVLKVMPKIGLEHVGKAVEMVTKITVGHVSKIFLTFISRSHIFLDQLQILIAGLLAMTNYTNLVLFVTEIVS